MLALQCLLALVSSLSGTQMVSGQLGWPSGRQQGEAWTTCLLARVSLPMQVTSMTGRTYKPVSKLRCAFD